MYRNYERYSNGIFSNNIVNSLSNVKVFRQQTLEKITPNSTRVMVLKPKLGDST